MKAIPDHSMKIRVARLSWIALSLLAMPSALAFADRGAGSIRAAGRQGPPERAPEHVEPAHVAEPPRDVHVEAQHPEAVHVEPGRDQPRPEAHPGPPPRVEVVHHDWDDNDEDARHWGGFTHGAPVHFIRGQRFHDLPPHHINLFFNHLAFFLDDTGCYYQQQPDGQYIIVQPPVGIVVAALPAGAIPIAVGPTTYDYLDGIYYVAVPNGFAVVNPPPGIVVPSLPTGATQVVINGTVVYQFDGFDYQPSLNDGVTVYTVVPA